MKKILLFRQSIGAWVDAPITQHIVLFAIIFNALTLGLETSSTMVQRYGEWLRYLDNIALLIFVAEIAAKIFAHGRRFFYDAWNVFDFVIVGIALLPNTGAFSILRALRVLRVLRVINRVPSLRFVADAILRAIPGISAIAGLMLIIFYVGAVMATSLFASQFPDWFGSIGRSLYTLFQVMTLESWSMGIARPVMEVYPWAWAFFIPFILIAAFTMLNLFVAVIVDTMANLRNERHQVSEPPAEDKQAAIVAELERLQFRTQQLLQQLKNDSST